MKYVLLLTDSETDMNKWLKFWVKFIFENYDYKGLKVKEYTEEVIELL